MSDTSENFSLPPGWDTKYDFKTGRRYYINYFTKLTSLEDPRIKYKKLQIGDSSFHSYQSSPNRSFSSQPFYHDLNYSSGKPSPIMGRSYSPLMGSNAIHYLAQKSLEYTTLEASVAKIKTLFPTAGETHIKALLHKYHYRETLVLSALQVEKHPLTTPGPYSSPLSAARHVIAQIAPSAPGSPGKFSFSSAFRNLSPRKTPHPSPKMKLRYLKSVFPVVEETVLLDTLCSSENNVHKATETLITMGFMKKDNKYNLKKHEAFSSRKELKHDSIYIPLHDPSPKIKTYEEKAKIKKNLEDKFEKIAEQIITLALETANYDEERAEQFLSSTVAEEKKQTANENLTIKRKDKENNKIISDVADSNNTDEKPFRDSGIWEKNSPDTSEDKSSVELFSCSLNESVTEKNICEKESETHNFIPDIAPKVSKKKNFISKTGYKLYTKIIPKGPSKSLLGSRCVAKGPNHELAKGSCKGLAKGSAFAVKSITTQQCNKDIQRGECSIF